MTVAKSARSWSWQQVVLGLVIAAGVLMHAGTALLRLTSFIPYPRLADFGSYYGGAYLLAHQQDPYLWPPANALALQDVLTIGSPVPNSAPAWLWLLLPWTWLPFPVAATLYLLILLAICFVCSLLLARIAGYRHWQATAIVFLLVVTFGPTFLNLTLGQTGLLLLLAMLLIGDALITPQPRLTAAAAVLWSLSILAKVFPVLWVIPPLLLRKWKLVAVTAGLTLGLSLLALVISPQANEAYVFRFLPERTSQLTGGGALDDQSLGAWLDRMGHSQDVQATTWSTSETAQANWQMPWDFDPQVIRIVDALLLLAILWFVGMALWRHGRSDSLPAFYLWVLFCLLAVPHTERYNHVLLLPAMAWLWARGDRARLIVAFAYLLTGLARLTHFWALLLPAPWGPLATGSGVAAVLLLIGALIYYLGRQSRQPAPI